MGQIYKKIMALLDLELQEKDKAKYHIMCRKDTNFLDKILDRWAKNSKEAWTVESKKLFNPITRFVLGEREIKHTAAVLSLIHI